MKFKKLMALGASIFLLPATCAKIMDNEMSTFDRLQFPASSQGGLAPQRELGAVEVSMGSVTIESLAQLARELPFEPYENYINSLAGRGILGFDIVPQLLAMARVPSS